MQELLPVLVPLINTNEADALLVNLAVKEGQWVEAGALLAVFETTKAAADLTAERKGYVRGLCFKVGETIHAGECFCYLSATADAPLPVEEEIQTPVRPAPTPEGLRITQPAMTLMQELGVSLEQLPQETLITEKYVRELFAPAARRSDPTALVVGSRDLAEHVARSVGDVRWIDAGGIPVEAWAQAAATIVAAETPAAVIAVATPGGRAIMGAIAARLDAPLLSDVTTIRAREGGIEAERPALGGLIVETLHASTPLCVLAAPAATAAVSTVMVPAAAVPTAEESEAAGRWPASEAASKGERIPGA